MTFPIIFEVTEMKGELVIVYGGKSCEHDISIITALYIYNAISLKDFNKTLVYLRDGSFYTGSRLEQIENYIDFDSCRYKKVTFNNGYIYEGDKKLKKGVKIDCALLCAHGGEGENGALQGYLQINDIPYTSSNVLGSSVTMDKVITKKILQSNNYKVLPYVVIKNGEEFSIEDIADKCGYPLIIKPANLGSSIGITVAKNSEQAIKGIELGLQYDNKLLIEKCLENFIEINCAAVKKDGQVMPSLPEKPLITSDILSYEDKYIKSNKLQTNREYPASIDEKLTARIQKLTARLYKDFELGGVVRIDYLIDGNDIYVNEINTIPGSLSYYLFSKQNINTSQLIDIMIKQAIKDKEENKKLITSFCSNVLSHYKGNKLTPTVK